MSYTHYERLSALDAAFLEIEDANAHMHVGSVSLFDAGPLTRRDGTIDLDRLRNLILLGIHRVPRYQQRLTTIPVFGHPIWVDDERFKLTYHLRHVSLPKPGDERLLKRLAGRIMSQQLDRGKPLWELWVVDGVEGDRIALITKAHHAMIDGVGSVELTGALLRPNAEQDPALDDPPPWLPRPAPSGLELMLEELTRRAREPVSVALAAGKAIADPAGTLRSLTGGTRGIAEALAAGFSPASPTPLNPEIGPHRRFDWLGMDLPVIKEVKNRFGGTVNDVVLALVSGGIRRFLRNRGLRPETLDFRAMIPVNSRDESELGVMGNKVSMMVARLPIGEADPRRRLELVSALTGRLKESGQALGVRRMEEMGEYTFPSVFAAFARLATRARPYNIVVTNVPGPQFPVYLLGTPMRAVYPLVPLSRNQALGIALFSYNGRLFWGFNSDWDAVPDLHDLVNGIQRELDILTSAAGRSEAEPPPPAPEPPPKPRRRRKER